MFFPQTAKFLKSHLKFILLRIGDSPSDWHQIRCSEGLRNSRKVIHHLMAVVTEPL